MGMDSIILGVWSPGILERGSSHLFLNLVGMLSLLPTCLYFFSRYVLLPLLPCWSGASTPLVVENIHTLCLFWLAKYIHLS